MLKNVLHAFGTPKEKSLEHLHLVVRPIDEELELLERSIIKYSIFSLALLGTPFVASTTRLKLSDLGYIYTLEH